MAQAKYRDAEEVQKLAEGLIEQHHRHLIDYAVKIRYLFIDKTPRSKGKDVWGTCRKISGLNAFLEDNAEKEGEPFFVITISEDIWRILPPDKKLALVDHELCHAWAEVKQEDEDVDVEEDNPVSLSIMPHDLEEFSCIVRRHGLWRDSIQEFIDALPKSDAKHEKAG